jgi:hypothetical protein
MLRGGSSARGGIVCPERGSAMSRFYDAVARAEALLRERRRLSLRGLRRELGLDPEALDALVASGDIRLAP